MALETESAAAKTPERSVRLSGLQPGWLQKQREAIRARGNRPIEFTPIKIKGEPLSMTILRERRGDFDEDPLS